MFPDDPRPGQQLLTYRVIRSGSLADIRSAFVELEHIETGAKHFHISNEDQENTFAVAFKTVPSDSSGVAHILEHTVLCGSRKYPVRDPFFSMLKRSLSTFMNAFTASDWTMYPFSTENRKDYYNLMGVYLDAVFYPNLDILSFKQEGHRLALDDAVGSSQAEKIVFKGVVYNEMKGAMSSPDTIMGRSLMNALYPDTTYGYNSGGDPEEIPRLTIEQLRRFHRDHYHPSNAFFYTYGNLNLEDHLEYIENFFLKDFNRKDIHTEVPPQPRWQNAKTVTYAYPLGKNESPEKKYQVSVAWLTVDIKSSFDVLVLTLISQILLGNSAAPLRKALIDSKLGSALADGTGFDSDNRDTFFACGLKDVRVSDAETVESIIFKVLNDLIHEGIDDELVEAALHQIEFHRKEVTNTPYPYGLKLLMAFSGSWFHGGDPERILNFDADIKALRKHLSAGNFLEEQLSKHFVDNQHRIRLILEPDQQLDKKRAQAAESMLSGILTDLSEEQLNQIKEDTTALEARQQGTEDISCLPTLALEDIPPSIKKSPPSPWSTSIPLTIYKKATAGIFYFASAMGIEQLPLSLVPLIPFFCHAVARVGTRRYDYSEMARKIDAFTGGVAFGAHARTGYDGSGQCWPFISFAGKCLNRNQEKMFEIIEEFLRRYAFSDRERLQSLLLEYRAALESMVVHNGHRLAISMASRRYSAATALSETWSGLEQIAFVKTLTEDLSDDKLEVLAKDLGSIGECIFSTQNVKMAFIGERPAIDNGIQCVEINHPLTDLSCPISEPSGFGVPALDFNLGEIGREGWSISSAVSFVASVFQTARMGHEDAPALAAISKLLRSMYLHREIREKGGAYGGFALYNPETGLFSYGSYRDPHIVSTLKVYERALDFIRGGTYSEEDIKEAVLQVCSDIDKPDPPGPAARKAFYRSILSLSDDARERYKAALLKLNREKVMHAAEKYFLPETASSVAVVSGEEQLRAANEKMPDAPLTLYRL